MAVSRHLPQLMAVLSDCCAVLGTWCHLCTGYFRKRGWLRTEMWTLSTALCFSECWVWVLLTLSVLDSFRSYPSLSHAACMCGLGCLCLQEVKEAQPACLRLPSSP